MVHTCIYTVYTCLSGGGRIPDVVAGVRWLRSGKSNNQFRSWRNFMKVLIDFIWITRQQRCAWLILVDHIVWRRVHLES